MRDRAHVAADLRDGRENLRPSRRPARLLGVLLAALVASLVLAAAAQAAVPREFFGTTAVRPDTTDFRKMAAGGLGTYRVNLSWRGIQPDRDGAYNWNGADQMFRWVATEGLRPVPVLFGSPEFISSNAARIKPPTKNKADRQEWRDFVTAAIARYGRGGRFWAENPTLPRLPVLDWIIWNEQNARAFWRPKASPSDYAKLVRLSRRALDDVDPAAGLVTGGVYGYPQHERSMYAKKFLKRLYRQRAMVKMIDGISVHPYGKRLGGVKKQVRDARKVARKAGDRSAELWIGEIGWASGGKGNHFLIKNRKKQARLLKQSMRWLLSKRRDWNVTTAFWFVWRDYETDEICNWCPQAGLLEQDGDAKPAWDDLRKLIAKRT